MERLVTMIGWLFSEQHVKERVRTKGRNINGNGIYGNDL
jgi:hypothetical protein